MTKSKKIKVFFTKGHYKPLLEKYCEKVEDSPDLVVEHYRKKQFVKSEPKHIYINGENMYDMFTLGGYFHNFLKRIGLKNLLPCSFYDCFIKLLNVSFSFDKFKRNIKEEEQFIEKMKPRILLTNKYKDFPCVPNFVQIFPDFDEKCSKFKNDSKNPSKRKFSAFIVSNSNKIDRIHFFKKLSKYKKVDSFGKVLNNRNFPAHLKAVNTKDYSLNPLIYKDYKFVICFENSFNQEYITEKLPNVMIANSIPIYKGAPNVSDYFNTKSFINFDDYGSYEKMIEKIIELDNDDKKYEEFLKQPWMTKENKENVKEKEKEFLEFLENAKNFAQNS